MKVSLLAREAWQPDLKARQRRGGHDNGYAALRLCHSSGLGVPVETAYEFADWLNGAGSGSEQWDRLFPEGLLRTEGMSISALIESMAQHPFHATRLLLFPVAARAQAVLDHTVFMTSYGQGYGEGITAAAPEHNVAFRDTVAALLGGGEDASAANVALPAKNELKAWRLSIGLRALQFLRDPSRWDSGLAEPDLLASELFLGAAQLEAADPARRSAVPQLQLASTRVSHRFQSDGIEGLRHAGPSEDPSSMLQSQMVYPVEVLAQRIANEGFVAFDRPPHLPERHRYVFCVLADLSIQTARMSVAQAAFWKAARDIEGELASSSGDLSFLWVPLWAPEDNVSHTPAAGERMIRGRPAKDWLQQFEDEGAPFRVLPEKWVTQQHQPADFAGSLADNVIMTDVAPEHDPESVLHLHVSVLADRQESLEEPGISTLHDEISAFASGHQGQAEVFLPADGDQIIFDGEETFKINTAFEDRCAIVLSLSRCWLASMRRIILDG